MRVNDEAPPGELARVLDQRRRGAHLTSHDLLETPGEPRVKLTHIPGTDEIVVCHHSPAAGTPLPHPACGGRPVPLIWSA